MNREIKFRGKRVDNGDWIHGDLIHCISGKKYIFPSDSYANESEKIGQEGCLMIFTFEVIPETVGQYTGVKDKNGKEIYEGEIIRFIEENCLLNFVENDCAFRVDVDSRISTALRKAHSKDYEIIGNIYDNPELLEVEK